MAYQHIIDGVLEGSDEAFDVINPATEEPVASCPSASRRQLDRAVAAAKRAYQGWSRLGYEERREALARYAVKLREIEDELVDVLVREQGKPLFEARDEVIRATNLLEEMCRDEPAGEILTRSPRQALLEWRPIGVIAAITPWNVPLILAARKIAHGLFAGNTMVLKPSPLTPLSTLLFGAASKDILPPGVLNVIAGGNELGQWLTEHPDIRRIAFTGSRPTGQKILVAAASSLKRVTLELGGNDPAIVLDDADPEDAARGLFRGAFMATGQICMAVKRIYAHDAVYDALVDNLTRIAEAQVVGDGLDPSTTMGPVQNPMQLAKVEELIEDTRRDRKARFTIGGHRLNRPGYFLSPAIVADAHDDMRLVQEEQFGPILPVLRYSDLDDVIRRANATEFGLAASIWSSDPDRAAAISQQIEAGTVWTNFHLGSSPYVPHGGFKGSGIGREFGMLGLLSYLEPQVISTPA